MGTQENYCLAQNTRIIFHHILFSLYLIFWSKYKDDVILGPKTLKFLTIIQSDDKLHKTTAFGSKTISNAHIPVKKLM
jgi:hypothetical protein